MKYFRVRYADERWEILKAESAIDLIRQYDFCTREHVNTRITELNGEQGAIARANDNE